MSSRTPSHILVTGSHRSGTTWVGKVVASAPRTLYIHEPFNVQHPNPLAGLRMSHWYQWIKEGTDEREKEAFQQLFSFRFRRTVAERRAEPALERAKRIGIMARDRMHAWRRHRIVLKDPIALLSAPWLTRNFDVSPVVCIRHPAAFVSSVRVKGWFFDFSSFLNQPGLVEEFFPEERPRLQELARCASREIITESAYLWCLLHKVIGRFQRDYPKWIFVRHEDLSRDAVREFGKLFAELRLPFTAETGAYLMSTIVTKDTRYVASSTPVSNVARNSAENTMVWKERLSQSEVATIRRVAGATGARFYADDEW